MLKMLIGLLEVDEGSIVFDGEDVTKIDQHDLQNVRRRVAYLFQGAALFDSLDSRLGFGSLGFFREPARSKAETFGSLDSSVSAFGARVG